LGGERARHSDFVIMSAQTAAEKFRANLESRGRPSARQVGSGSGGGRRKSERAASAVEQKTTAAENLVLARFGETGACCGPNGLVVENGKGKNKKLKPQNAFEGI
jgi:hypothetical protein